MHRSSRPGFKELACCPADRLRHVQKQQAGSSKPGLLLLYMYLPLSRQAGICIETASWLQEWRSGPLPLGMAVEMVEEEVAPSEPAREVMAAVGREWVDACSGWEQIGSLPPAKCQKNKKKTGPHLLSSSG